MSSATSSHPSSVVGNRQPNPTPHPGVSGPPLVARPLSQNKGPQQLAQPAVVHDPVEEPDPEPMSLSYWKHFLPVKDLSSYSLSALMHLVIVFLLAFLTLSMPKEEQNLSILSSNDRNEIDPMVTMPEVELDLEVVEEEAIQSLEMMSQQFSAQNLLRSGMDSLHAEEIATLEVGLDGFDQSLLDAGQRPGEGSGVAASFFGIRTEGKRFVYLVDNSKSMNKEMFEMARTELLQSVSKLDREQRFYVIFFSDKPYPLYYPDTAPDMVHASDVHIRRLSNWIERAETILKTKALESVKMALDLRPDAIFILTDGRFTDGTKQYLMNTAYEVPVHTVFIQKRRKDARAERDLRDIALAHNSTYRVVDVPPAKPKDEDEKDKNPNAKNKKK
ncbi:Hypothetical protein PBC10988_31330 [Planctomycetales bacterium 10988]|nr:Hypothetical protein PBC10988_31330 [Planctomycetales bacterium 10988]